MREASLRLRHLWRLAARDLVWERTLAFCAAGVIAAALTPVWVLWGLQSGVVGTLIERMEKDPQLRRVTPVATGASRFDDQWLHRVRSWPEVAFVLPTVRYAASLVDLGSPQARAPLNAELFETAVGDPLLAGISAPGEGQVVLSAAAAARLRAAPGDRVQVAFARNLGGRQQLASLDLSVSGVLPVSGFSREAAFVTRRLLADIESWRDGYSVPDFGGSGSGPAPAREAYARFRLHTHSIRQVEAVASRLESEGVALDVDFAPIAATLGLQRNLIAILTIIAVVTLSGAVVAVSALQAANLRRKRREHALLKLTGHGRAWLVAIPCVQATLVAFSGIALAGLLYVAGALAINRHFAAHLAQGEAAVALDVAGVLAGCIGALVAAVVPAVWAGWAASRVEAADELREQ